MTEPELCLYNLTLRYQQNSIRSCVGNFSGKKSQEIITATSNSLIVYKVDSNDGKLIKIASVQIFAIIRSIVNFKIAGSGKDYLALTSDSGNLSILEFDIDSNSFKNLFNEPCSKTGIRRLSPGFELVVENKGRAVLLTAIERNKLCYVLNRDLNNNLTISSPLEANRSNILTLTSIGLDVGYDNPLFATIEIDHSESSLQRYLTYYELDLGLNNIIKKKSEKINNTSNYLLQVPGGSDGPSGVLICSENLITYKNLYKDYKLSINIPKLNNQNSFIISGVVHKMKNKFFFLIQNQFGDLFKLELIDDSSLTISYFDSIPISSSLIILKSGFLFADTDYGDKCFYQFEKLGDEDPFVSTSNEFLNLSFKRNAELDNLLLVDIIESLNPIIDSKLIQTDNNSSIFTLSGIDKSSSLKILQYGVPINEIVESELPPFSNKVFTTKVSKFDEFDKYLIISFNDSTLVLSIGESVEEVTDSGIALNEHTLDIKQVGNHSIAQIHSNGIRIIKENRVVNDWLPPAGIKILCASTTNKQVAIGLSNDELIYFEIDQDDRLIEFNQHKEFQSKITSISLGDIPEDGLRSPFLIVGCNDSTIRVLNTSPNDTLESMSLQALTSVPNDLLILEMNNNLYVHIGLENGVYIRTLLDDKTGSLSDTRTKYLGSEPVLLNKLIFNNSNIVLACSNNSWLIHDFNNNFQINKILIDNLKYGSIFNSEDIRNGIVGIHDKKLTIFTIQELFQPFNLNSISLKTTGKKILNFENNLFILERFENSNIIEKFNINGELENSITLKNEESIIFGEIIKFETKENQPFLLISIAKNFNSIENKLDESFIYVYDLNLNFIHMTKFNQLINSFIEFQGKVLIGMNNYLKIFDIGKKQLLSKSSTKIESINKIVKIESQGLRVFVGDVKESITFLVFKPELNEFFPFIDDSISRYITTFKILDYFTVVVGDKFGNISILRCDEETSEISEKNITFLNSQGNFLNGSIKKFKNLCNFYVEDIVTSFELNSLVSSGQEVIIYTGLQGTIGILLPIQTKIDIRFFNKLQKAIRLNYEDLTGRDNLKFRSYYQPIKNVIDGDLIELFNELPIDIKIKIGKEIGKLPKEISKKIFEIRALST